MSNDRGSSSGENQKTEQCIQEFRYKESIQVKMMKVSRGTKKVIDKRVKLTHMMKQKMNSGEYLACHLKNNNHKKVKRNSYSKEKNL